MRPWVPLPEWKLATMKYEAENTTKGHLRQILEDEKKHEIEECAHDKMRVKTMKVFFTNEHKKSRLEHIKKNHCCGLSKLSGAKFQTNVSGGGCSITNDAKRVEDDHSDYDLHTFIVGFSQQHGPVANHISQSEESREEKISRFIS